LLFSHLKKAPRIIQDLFGPCLSSLQSLYESYPEIKQFADELKISSTLQLTMNAANMALFSNYLNILQIKNISDQLNKARKICNSSKAELALMLKEYKMYK